MHYKKYLYILLTMILAATSLTVFAQEGGEEDQSSDAFIIDDFESDELNSAFDGFSNPIGMSTWGNTPDNVNVSIAELERDGNMDGVLAIEYDIPSDGWGGITHYLTDGENWISQDWTDYNALQFWLYGANTGTQIQVEIFDNRNPDLTADSAERWFVRIDDNYEGWQQFTIPFDAFQRRTDFQPGGAPNDGLGLDEVSGYAFAFPVGVGAQTAYLDQVELVRAQAEPIMVNNFEELEELFLAEDEFGNDIGFVTFGDTEGNVQLRLTEAVRDGEDTMALAAEYDIAQFGGFTHVFNDGENWVSQDWTAYNGISFWYFGRNTGADIQFEIFDNRAEDSTGDTAERWFYRFTDDLLGWKLVEIPFVDFERRSDWQPGGAPDDGFNLNAVSGYAFTLPAGIGEKTALIDNVRVISMAGVDQPEGVVVAAADAGSDDATGTPALPPAELEPVEPNPDFLAELPEADPLLVTDFESGLVLDTENLMLGYSPWGDTIGNTVISSTLTVPFSDIALPETEEPNLVLQIDYNIGSFGGFDHKFTNEDATEWVSQDWTDYNALSFWLYGNGTNQIIQVELMDNVNPDEAGDSAERFYFRMLDDFEGWNQVTIPFALFQRRTDWQPSGAPNDGLELTEAHGYAIGFPAGVGQQTAYVDNVQVVVVEDPTVLAVTAPADPDRVEIDDTIGWDAREWELVWSDEFDADAGVPINDEYWTCRIGNEGEAGTGWGNQELQYYTDTVENVSHDGEGNLVITAREGAPADGGSCWYGECLYTSARCITQDKVEFQYGRVETRMLISGDQGIWSAFWMLGSSYPEVAWPASGEIDIMENFGREFDIGGALHGPGYSGGSNIGATFQLDEPISEGYHVIAIDWDPNVIRWYIDGRLVNVISSNALNGRDWVYNDEFFLLMNLAVGGLPVGDPPEDTTFPQQLLVDYVRVYELAE